MPVNDFVGAKSSQSMPPEVPGALIRSRRVEDRLFSVEQRLTAAAKAPVALALQNGWVHWGPNYEAPGAYRANGMIYLVGLVKRSSDPGSNTLIAQLPEHQRPAYRHLYPVYSDAGVGRVDVDVNGSVLFMAGGFNFTSLDGIVFPAA